ncbi:MAG TPA: SDR family oxidoreductase [Verrucomicrobiae bacterium]|nr:SDR family oxidoreductase [Verrucomicrobiae bacterium]
MRTWLVTGAAGFIGSHLVETLVARGERVIALDLRPLGGRASARATTIQADIRDLAQCRKACAGVDYVLHQAAQCSVPASIKDPLATHETNVTGFLNMVLAARDAGVKRFVFASSCAVYGNSEKLPNSEDRTGNFLSPYALSKYLDELYANMFGIETIGLRYFNVYGPRQDPNGAYAAVVPRWITALLKGEPVTIFGDGETTRDFVFVGDVVNANLLAAETSKPEAACQVYNVASGKSVSLNTLYSLICKSVGVKAQPIHADFRAGDIRHSSADISKPLRLLGFKAAVSLEQGLEATVAAFRTQ